jgi:hypothetical protein
MTGIRSSGFDLAILYNFKVENSSGFDLAILYNFKQARWVLRYSLGHCLEFVWYSLH